VLFLIFAWSEPGGVFAAVTLALLAVEVAITIADFIEEDRTRHLPPFERLLHTVLAVLYGGFLALAVPWLIAQTGAAHDMAPASHGLLSGISRSLPSASCLRSATRLPFAVRRLGAHDIGDVPPSGRSVSSRAPPALSEAPWSTPVARRVFAYARCAPGEGAVRRVRYVERLTRFPSKRASTPS
jgi:hypothetical protein